MLMRMLLRFLGTDLMPHEIINMVKYLDKTVQDWHRRVFPKTSWAIDVDLLGACHICRHPLYLIEGSENPDKPISILYQLAIRANIPAFLILHRDKEVVGGRQSYPQQISYNSESEIRTALEFIRMAHMVAH
jgi:hypothetical protein